MLRIPKSQRTAKILSQLGNMSKLLKLPPDISSIVLGNYDWQFIEEDNYDPNIISYKPPELASKTERVTSLMVQSLSAAARVAYFWGNGDCLRAAIAHRNGTSPRRERIEAAEYMVSLLKFFSKILFFDFFFFNFGFFLNFNFFEINVYRKIMHQNLINIWQIKIIIILQEKLEG